MNDIIKKLNSIDVMDFFKKKSTGQPSASALTERLKDSKIFQVDKMLLLLTGLGIILFTVGGYQSVSTWQAHQNLSQLQNVYAQLENTKTQKKAEIDAIKSQNLELLEKISDAPSSQSDLMKRLSDTYAKSGLTITKIITGTATEPQLIKIDAEGSFDAIRSGLEEIKKISPSLEMKSVTVAYDKETGFLKLNSSFKFVTPPKIDTQGVTKKLNAALFDSLPSRELQSTNTNRGFFQRVQFQPKNNSSGSGNIASGTATGPSVPNNGKVENKADPSANSLGRNPFYMPPPTGAQQGFDSGVDLNARNPGMNPPGGVNQKATGRSPGTYLIGCMLLANQAACVFQLADGSSAIFNRGQKIEFGVELLKVTDSGVTLRTPNGDIFYKVGEQIK